jgi:hypothetical protein
MFKGLFTRRSLEIYYYEALFILEQEYEDLKKTLMINEVIMLALTLIENEMFPSDMFMPNVYNILLKGILDIMTGRETIIYPEKIMRRFTKSINICIEKEKMNSMESIEHYMKFTDDLIENFDLVPNSLKNSFIGNFVDFAWFLCSDFNFFMSRRTGMELYTKNWLKNYGEKLEFLLDQTQIEEVQTYDLLLQKVHRLVYIGVELITESWDDNMELSDLDKKQMCSHFEILYICMKNKFTSMASFTELKEQCPDGAFTIFDRFFMMLTKQSHPLSLEQDFGQILMRCIQHWKIIFKRQINDEEFVELKLGILIQINMILFQIIKFFDLNKLTHFVVDFITILIRASIDLIGTLSNKRKKREFTKDIRVCFDEILTKINFGRVPRRFEEKMSKLNELIVLFLGKIDNLSKGMTHKSARR